MKTRQEVIQYCCTFEHVREDYPFRDPNWTCMRIQTTNKIFAWIYEKEQAIWVNVKCDPQWRDLWRSAYRCVVPAYHMNKEHWNSVILGGDVPEAEVKRMIAESYELCCLGKRKKKTS